ncbi:Hematopoietic prostaglandin D synthase [Trichoplax sp. H2]|nr:Hematopoietic prostaglandin D synthase [Trichoplax sp. H2]|eukprot:RDD47699.1 Hematopoietic prostaglandin D synthase [Trichoplax sp. H2]
MPSIKLTYFNIPGRAEIARLIFTQAGLEYVDERIEKSDWPELKSSGRFPFQQIPVLEIDGNVFFQSGAITRAAAGFTGLAGKTNLEQAQADEIYDFLTVDLREPMITFYVMKDEEKKEQLRKKFVEETAPKGLGFLERRLENAGGEYFTGNLTYADIAFYEISNNLLKILDGGEWADKFPKLTALRDRIANLPNIKNYKQEFQF